MASPSIISKAMISCFFFVRSFQRTSSLAHVSCFLFQPQSRTEFNSSLVWIIFFPSSHMYVPISFWQIADMTGLIVDRLWIYIANIFCKVDCFLCNSYSNPELMICSSDGFTNILTLRIYKIECWNLQTVPKNFV